MRGKGVVFSVRDASIGRDAEVGPYVSLRVGSELHEGSKAGTFVEVKNSVVGRGAKVPHLAYVGDADIGDEANIGAGTITANYNGFEKHRTRVGRRVQIGSNTVLVAPVEVGDDAYTGAGSAITRNVSEGALGIERSAQREIPGYAERRRARYEAGLRWSSSTANVSCSSPVRPTRSWHTMSPRNWGFGSVRWSWGASPIPKCTPGRWSPYAALIAS